jgi:hypothetical protein
VSALPAAELPDLRRLPVPVAEPRPALRVVRDQPGSHVTATQGTLFLPTPDHEVRSWDLDDDEAKAYLPPPAANWTRQFVQAALEVAAGRRPASQLLRWTSDDVFATLARRGTLATRLERVGAPPRSGRPLRGSPVTVRSVRLCHPMPGVVEASAVIGDRDRVRAVALRLEDGEGRWRVTALELG